MIVQHTRKQVLQNTAVHTNLRHVHPMGSVESTGSGRNGR